MGKRDPRITTYIAKQRDWQRPMFTYLRAVIHEACPDVEETLKWRSPTFMHHGILCGFAGFKEHAMFGFWKHTLLFGTKQTGMGSFGRLTSANDLPSKKEITALIKKAMKLNEDGVKAPSLASTRPKQPVRMHASFRAALTKNKRASGVWSGFSPSKQREYLEWIGEAKTDDTRSRRVVQSVEWIAQGKPRNWKYM